MVGKEPAYFDPGTVAVLREILDDAWACLPQEQQATMLKTTLAERILKLAAQGERDRQRFLNTATLPVPVVNSIRLALAAESDDPPRHAGSLLGNF
jgi:hypothetical protein